MPENGWPDLPGKYLRETLKQDQGNARWLIRMMSGYEYRASIYELPAGTGVAGLYTPKAYGEGTGAGWVEYIRLDRIEAVRRLD